LASNVVKECGALIKLIGDLANDTSVVRNTPMRITAKADPYVSLSAISNEAVSLQYEKLVRAENTLQDSIISMQQNSATFETGIVRAIQSAWQTCDEWQSRASNGNQEIYRSLSAHMASLSPDQEWISFAARSDHLLDPETPLRDPALITYPCKDDPSVFPAHTGHLERKMRFSRSYQESYFVLTPAGFLHAFNNSDPSHPSGHGLNPAFSLFLPNCTLGPPSAPNSKRHKFHIEGRKDGTGTTKSGSFRSLLGGDNSLAWSFRARSRQEMMEWWNDIRMLCARYLVASEQIERNGPVEAAVRSAGYDTEGSSAEGQIDETAHPEPRPPGYPYEKGYHGAEIGPHGYMVSRIVSTFCSPSPYSCFNSQKKTDPTYDLHDIHAHPSVRQQEKAAEGHISHMYYDTVGQDTVQVAPQITGTLSAAATHSPRIVHGSGYVPDDLALEGSYDRDPHDPHYFAPQTGDSPRQVRTATLSPQPVHRTDSPRVSGSQGRLSPRHGMMSPHHTGSPQQSPAILREVVSSPNYASGTTASQYAAADAPPAVHDYDALHAAEEGEPAPITLAYTGEEYAEGQ
jgi:hypothetical protein